MIGKPFNKNFKKAFSLIELSIVVLIIGILIAGITSGSRLVRNSKLASAAQFTKSSDVNSIPDLVLWLEPTMPNSFAIDPASSTGSLEALPGSNYNKLTDKNNANYIKDTDYPSDLDYISRWNDINPRATSKKSVVQDYNSNRPRYVANAINGLPALRFNIETGSLVNGPLTFLYSRSDHITTPQVTPLLKGDDSFTYIAVFRTSPLVLSNIGNGHMAILDQSNGNENSITSSQNLQTAMTDSGYSTIRQLNIHQWGVDESIISASVNRTLEVDKPTIGIVGLEDSIKSTNNNYLNCVLNLSGSNCKYGTLNTAHASINVDDKQFTIGTMGLKETYYRLGDYAYPGYIAEVMVFDRLISKEEINIISRYLSKKWGISYKPISYL